MKIVCGTYDPSADATATEADILSGKTACVNGTMITGTLIKGYTSVTLVKKGATNGYIQSPSIDSTGLLSLTIKWNDQYGNGWQTTTATLQLS